MRNRAWFFLLALSCLIAAPARADRLKPGDWIGTGGLGFMSSPALFMVSPQIERVYQPNLFLGALMQAGFGGAGSLVSITFTGRYQMGLHPRLRPTLEGGLGFAAGSAAFSSSFGVAFHLGMGVEYLVTNEMALGTLVRANFAPPVMGFFLSWSLVQMRFLF